jgi:hypothetical protein
LGFIGIAAGEPFNRVHPRLNYRSRSGLAGAPAGHGKIAWPGFDPAARMPPVVEIPGRLVQVSADMP